MESNVLTCTWFGSKYLAMEAVCLEQQVVEGQGEERLDLLAGPVVADIALLWGEPGGRCGGN